MIRKQNNHKTKFENKDKREADWRNNKEKVLQGLKKVLRRKYDSNPSEQHSKSLTLKTPSHDGIHGYWF